MDEHGQDEHGTPTTLIQLFCNQCKLLTQLESGQAVPTSCAACGSIKVCLTSDVVLVAISLRDGRTYVMQFVIDDHRAVRQVATVETVQAEIDRQPYVADVKSWRFVELADLPGPFGSRGENRKLWRDDGKTIKVHG